MDTCSGFPYRPVGIWLYICMVFIQSSFTTVCFKKNLPRGEMCVYVIYDACMGQLHLLFYGCSLFILVS
jgi:hypothetical protein